MAEFDCLRVGLRAETRLRAGLRLPEGLGDDAVTEAEDPLSDLYFLKIIF